MRAVYVRGQHVGSTENEADIVFNDGSRGRLSAGSVLDANGIQVGPESTSEGLVPGSWATPDDARSALDADRLQREADAYKAEAGLAGPQPPPRKKRPVWSMLAFGVGAPLLVSLSGFLFKGIWKTLDRGSYEAARKAYYKERRRR